MYICGLKGIEEGVDEAIVDIGRLRGIDWLASKSEMRAAVLRSIGPQRA
jgi:benzoyl-CoA 2,3-dioxygenase component A